LVKVRRPGKKKGLELLRKGPHTVVRYQDEQGFLEFDGGQLCLLQDDDEQVWKSPGEGSAGLAIYSLSWIWEDPNFIHWGVGR
jgi:hypothetical protein